MNLFEKCLQNLSNKASALSAKETEKIELILQRVFPFISSNIDWTKNNNNQIIGSEDSAQIVSALKKLWQQPLVDKAIYVVWDSNYPGVKTDLDTAISYLDDITSIGTRTWLFNPEIGYIVEWHWCGNKTVGIASHERILLGKALKGCLDALFSECKILSFDQSKQILKLLKNRFGFKHMVVDWDIITIQRTFHSPSDIIQSLKQLVPVFSKSVYLLWDKVEQLPVFKTNLNLVIENWNKVINVGSLSYILDLETQYVIGLYKDKILIGLAPNRD